MVYERGKDAQRDGCVDQLEEWGAQVPVGAMHWRKKQDWVLVRCAEGSWAVVRSLQLGGEKGMSSAREFCAKQLKGKAYKPSDKEFRYICVSLPLSYTSTSPIIKSLDLACP